MNKFGFEHLGTDRTRLPVDITPSEHAADLWASPYALALVAPVTDGRRHGVAQGQGELDIILSKLHRAGTSIDGYLIMELTDVDDDVLEDLYRQQMNTSVAQKCVRLEGAYPHLPTLHDGGVVEDRPGFLDPAVPGDGFSGVPEVLETPYGAIETDADLIVFDGSEALGPVNGGQQVFSTAYHALRRTDTVETPELTSIDRPDHTPKLDTLPPLKKVELMDRIRASILTEGHTYMLWTHDAGTVRHLHQKMLTCDMRVVKVGRHLDGYSIDDNTYYDAKEGLTLG